MNRSLTFRWASRIAAVAAILLVSVTSLFAQQRVTVSGTVFDESNLPMVGVGVMQKGTTNGVATDLDGKYTISVPAGSTLVFSSIGYLEQEISAPANGGTLNVSLLPDTQTIEETVVVGYGVQKKSDLTGSISSVKEVDLSNRTLTDAAQALQGKTAGVYISMSSGAPGSEGTVRIRGVGTNGNSRPLYVIDGSISRNGISNLNPEDIESMEILKDGASTAIYGARAGNGVILVTTKRGSGDGRISYQFQTSLNTFGRLPEVMNSQEFYDYYLENGSIPQSQMDANWDKKTSTDWVKELREPSFMQRHNVTFQKGDANGNIFISAQYMKTNGPMKGDKDVFERMNFTINGSWRFKKWLQLQTNNQFGLSTMRSVGNGSLTNAVRLDPHTPAFYDSYDALPSNLKGIADDRAQYGQLLQDADGRYYGIPFYSTLENPFISLYSSDSKTLAYSLNGTTSLILTPLKGFTFTSRIGYRINVSNSHTTNFDRYANGNSIQNYASVNASINMPTYYQWENFANYSRSFGKHDFTLMAGMSYSQDLGYSISGSVTGSNSDYGFIGNTPKYLYWAFRSGNATHTVSGAEPIYTRNLSYYGRLNWNYANRYIAQVSLRADAADSSVLPIDNRWGYFPAVSLGWTISNEEFWSGIKNAFPYVKFRASWGANGSTANLGDYSWASSMINSGFYPAKTGPALTDYQYIATYIPAYTGNKKLKWESSQQLDFGVDMRFLNDRLTVTADYYKKITRDLIISGAKPSFSVGNVSSPINAGEITNSGFELELGWQDKIGDFGYSIRGNMATLKNMVNEVDPSLKTVMGVGIHPRQGQTRFEAGYPAWHFYGFKFKEIDPADGFAVFYDKDGNTTKEPLDADYTDLGSGLPKVTAGLTINLDWKNWSLLVFASGAFGQTTYMFYDSPIGSYNKLKYFTDDRWTPSNKNATRPAANAGNNYTNWLYSSANVVNSSYIKIKQVQLGYNLPKSFLDKIRFQQARVYVSLDNFFTFTKYPGYDPEVVGTGSGQGVDQGSYPLMRQAVFGLNLTF
ncbi:MAG: TonB-dependent receptor [Bacteroidales bacterium]|nr:TonB-dependent receptor [Bacteroidales bacterium]